MSRTERVVRITESIGDRVAAYVGEVGRRAEVVSRRHEDYVSVELSRGGLVAEGRSFWTMGDFGAETGRTPALGRSGIGTKDVEYRAGLAVIRHSIGEPGTRDGEDMISLDTTKSGSYVFEQDGKDGRWAARYVNISETVENAHTDITTYAMLGAEVLQHPDRLEQIHELLDEFAEATSRRVDLARKWPD